MQPLDAIRSEIPAFAGYANETDCGHSDEQVRAFAGERLAIMRDAPAASRDDAQAEILDRLLLRAEFANQVVLRGLENGMPPEHVDALLQADVDLIAAAKAGDLAAMESAFDRRERAMRGE